MQLSKWCWQAVALLAVATMVLGGGGAGCALFDSRPKFKDFLTDREYSDFVLRFDFRLASGTHGLVGLRSQMRYPVDLDNTHFPGLVLALNDDSIDTVPGDHHGSLIGIAAAKPGALKPSGEWNTQEIRAVGRHITVRLNGAIIVDKDLDTIRDLALLRAHPEMFLSRGQIIFIARRGGLQIRNARIAEIQRPHFKNEPDNDSGFRTLFNGKDLNGWQGELRRLVDYTNDPIAATARLNPQQRVDRQKQSNRRMREHWSVVGGELVADGAGDNLVTTRDFGNFELLIDWRTSRRGASGIFLRGQPQVQIWDPLEGNTNAAVGSGGLYFGTNLPPAPPSYRADHAPGQWNQFRILLIGDRVHVFLNDQIVLRDAPLKNYWAPGQAILARGPIELQNYVDPKHRLRPTDLTGPKLQGNLNYFRNLFIREIR